jgi:hypothetical protein
VIFMLVWMCVPNKIHLNNHNTSKHEGLSFDWPTGGAQKIAGQIGLRREKNISRISAKFNFLGDARKAWIAAFASAGSLGCRISRGLQS